MTEVHVSRVFHVDENSPGLLDEIAKLARRGFTVLGPIRLEPVEDAGEPSSSWETARRLRAAIQKAAGLSGAEIAAVLGVSPTAVYQWCCKSSRTRCSPARIEEMQKLLERAKSLPKGSTVLRDEARGARLAVASLPSRRKSPPISDEHRLAIGILREQGLTVDQIAASVGRSRKTVQRALKDVGV